MNKGFLTHSLCSTSSENQAHKQAQTTFLTYYTNAVTLSVIGRHKSKHNISAPIGPNILFNNDPVSQQIPCENKQNRIFLNKSSAKKLSGVISNGWDTSPQT